MNRKAEGTRRNHKIITILFWLVVWQLLAMFVNNEILLATPLQTLAALVRLLGKITFWQTVLMSLGRIFLGFILGLSIALVLAWFSSRYAMAEELLWPVITLCKSVPVAVFAVLLLIWWGSSFLSVAICFLIVLPTIYINTLEGLKNTDKKLLEMASVFTLPTRTQFFYIYRPALKPFLYSSLKLSLGMCWKSGVAAEVIGTPAFSIGEQLYLSKIYLDTAGVFAWAIVIVLLSVGFEQIIQIVAERFFSWEPACRKSERTETEPKVNLTVEKLCKSYGDLQVLTDVNEIYEPGKIYYLTSPSGSGKTTLLRILCGLETMDSGMVMPHYPLCSMVFQEDRLCEDYSAVRNVEQVMGSRELALEALEKLLPAEALHKPCSQLSGGMKRRVALVRAMESHSDYVLLDEPFTGMDGETKALAERYIKEKQNGRTILIATHI